MKRHDAKNDMRERERKCIDVDMYENQEGDA